MREIIASLLLMVKNNSRLDMVERINAPHIEAPTLFKGRGDHPKAGFLKSRVQP